MSFKKILIAVDESAFAAHAADVAIELAKSLNAEMAFVHVVDRSLAPAGPEIDVPVDKLITMAELEGEKLLSAFRERAGASPSPLEFLEIGKPATEIVQCAKDWPADLIVIGSRGRGGVGSMIRVASATEQDTLPTDERSQSEELDLQQGCPTGSVAWGVLRHAHCPVVVVPPQA